MPDRSPCPRCRKTGFIRIEHVIKAGLSVRSCYCGACDHQWQVDDEGRLVAPGTNEPPDRSRNSL